MKLSLALILILFSIFPIHQLQSQQHEYVSSSFSPVMDFYSSNYLNGYSSGRGNTGIASESGLSGVLLNPASLNLKKDYELNLQYTVKTIQPWNFIFQYSQDMAIRQNWFFSGSAGFAFQINKNLNAAVTYCNPSSLLFYYGESAEVSGTSYDTYSRVQTHSFRVPISFHISKFSFGVSLIYNIYEDAYHGYVTTIQDPGGTSEQTITESAKRFNAQFGIQYKPTPNLTFGATFTPGFKSTLSEDAAIEPERFLFVARYPAKGGVGASYEIPDSKVKLYADYNFEDMKVIPGYKDRHNFNVGADYYLNKKITLRGGFFTLFNGAVNTAGVQYIIPTSTYDQYFLTAGATFFFKNSDLTVSFLDSHFSGGRITNTFLNLSYSAQF